MKKAHKLATMLTMACLLTLSISSQTPQCDNLDEGYYPITVTPLGPWDYGDLLSCSWPLKNWDLTQWEAGLSPNEQTCHAANIPVDCDKPTSCVVTSIHFPMDTSTQPWVPGVQLNTGYAWFYVRAVAIMWSTWNHECYTDGHAEIRWVLPQQIRYIFERKSGGTVSQWEEWNVDLHYDVVVEDGVLGPGPDPDNQVSVAERWVGFPKFLQFPDEECFRLKGVDLQFFSGYLLADDDNDITWGEDTRLQLFVFARTEVY